MRKLLLLITAIMVLTGCGKKTLDRETAKKLLEGRQFETIEGHIGSAPDYLQFRGDRAGVQALVQLGQGNMVACTESACQPGSAANGALRGGGAGGFTYAAGSFVLGEISGITQSSPTTATAEVQLAFSPTKLYAQYKGVLDGADTGNMAFVSGPSLAARTQPRTIQVQFQLFDDGWRVQ